MALIDTMTTSRPRGGDVPPSSPRLQPFERDGLGRRALPFLAAIAVGIALLPLDNFEVMRWSWLAPALGLLAGVVAVGLMLSRTTLLPEWTGTLVPFAYLAAIALLREGTGGATSGYGSLMFLAPFWVALYDTRRQVVATTVVIFLLHSDVPDIDAVTLRRALLSVMVIGFMSLAVHRMVSKLRLARDARELAYEQLADSAAALERSNQELEQFAYVSSHDIQEPLRMIRSFSQLFVQRHGHQLDDEGKELLGFVVDGAERAQQMVNDLLQYSLIGRSERELEPTSLESALDRALSTLAPNIEDAGARIERVGTLPSVVGDAQQLDNLLVNLVGNALKYHHPDRAPVVQVSADRLDGWVTVRIADNGIGFAPENAEKIFLMFHRLHGRTTYEGTGIGLAICSRIVDRHGGTIRAISRLDEGATFEFTISAADPNGAP